jgi:ABC-type transport system involved in multi-copper enzyme maturation permease subunit
MIVAKTWREVRWMTLVYLLLLEFLLVAAVYYWPILAESIRKNPFLENLMPIKSLKDAFATFRHRDQDIAYGAYLATQQFFKGCNIVGIACAVLMGTGAIARERENGTLELLFSRPVGRARILSGKFAVIATCVIVPIFLTSLTAIPLSAQIDRPVALGPILHASFHAALFVLDFLCLTLLLSALFPTQVHVAFAVGGFTVVQVGLYFVQQIRAFSIFRLSDFEVYAPILAGNVSFARMFWEQEVWMILAAAVLCGAAYAVTVRRDL